MARIVSTAAAYQQLAQRSQSRAGQAAWLRDYEARHPSVFESYYSAWGDVDRRAAAAARVREFAPHVPSRESRARDLIERAEVNLREHDVLDGEDVPAVLLVGVGSSNGWVAHWQGQPTLFLALELLPDPPYDDVLVAHEMTHLAHHRCHRDPWPETVGTRLFAEGLAGAISRRVVPQLPLDAYLWFDDAHHAWLTECEGRGNEISGSMLAALSFDERLGQRFFSARPELAGGLPVRSGYFVGLLAVQRLLAEQRERSSRPLLRWNADTATAQLAAGMCQLRPRS